MVIDILLNRKKNLKQWHYNFLVVFISGNNMTIRNYFSLFQMHFLLHSFTTTQFFFTKTDFFQHPFEKCWLD